ncbi:MAG TPA: helix-hairpin-helix domain-containing protein [Saprospiraceae bacterium]|nr:helix-hairpin-helix domain-containing protein [Saprospiraceae bacterium]
MKPKKNIKLRLTVNEKAKIKNHKIRVSDILEYDPGELELLLDLPGERAAEIHALALFQTVPSIGIKFAEDLVFLGYYSFEALRDKDGAQLTDDFEQKKAYRIDPCVEDQFRLIVHYAKTHDTSKNWWDFTEERKKYRIEHGYPSTRPGIAWHQDL